MRRLSVLLRGGVELELQVLDREAVSLELQHASAVIRREKGEVVGSYTITDTDGAKLHVAWRDVLGITLTPRSAPDAPAVPVQTAICWSCHATTRGAGDQRSPLVFTGEFWRCMRCGARGMGLEVT